MQYYIAGNQRKGYRNQKTEETRLKQSTQRVPTEYLTSRFLTYSLIRIPDINGTASQEGIPSAGDGKIH